MTVIRQFLPLTISLLLLLVIDHTLSSVYGCFPATYTGDTV